MSTTPARMQDLPVPALIERHQRTALVAGLIGLALTAVGLAVNPGQVFRSYLFGFLFWTGIAVGCLSISLIHHLTGGMWGLVIRRLLEAGAGTFPLCAALFVPVAAALLLPPVTNLPYLYSWADPQKLASDHLLQHKQPYLNVPFFLGRAAFYFLVWSGLAWAIGRASLEMDATAGDDRRYLRVSGRLRGLAGAGLLLMGLTITFSAVDWAMSLDPHWFSTVYGVMFMVGQALSALALVIVLVALLSPEPPFARVILPLQVHDLGKLLLAFVMLWAYINVSQLIIIWSANIPEETPWYIERVHGGWQWLALALVVFHFALPFLMLLSRDLKRDARRLAVVAGAILLMRMLDLYWLVGPSLDAGHGHGLHPHWLDVTALVGVGGLWLWSFARGLRQRPLLPVGEPEIRERLLEAQA